jgi:putative heme-binding domain-containing protein
MKYLRMLRLAAVLAAALLASLAAGQQARKQKVAGAGVKGQQIFASACASCHGLDGRGGERAPDIASSSAVQRLSNEDLVRIVTEGVTGTGMPAFHSLGTANITAVVKYLRVLQGKEQPSVLPGDASRGQALFFGQAGCSSCHMVEGKGGFLGADLSAYAKAHGAEEIRRAIVKPEERPSRVRNAVITAKDGAAYRGLVRNEDNFSIQLQTVEGMYLFLSKSDIAKLDYDPAPVMPADYDQKLTAKDLNDLVSYLMTAAKNSKAESIAEDRD